MRDSCFMFPREGMTECNSEAEIRGGSLRAVCIESLSSCLSWYNIPRPSDGRHPLHCEQIVKARLYLLLFAFVAFGITAQDGSVCVPSTRSSNTAFFFAVPSSPFALT